MMQMYTAGSLVRPFSEGRRDAVSWADFTYMCVQRLVCDWSQGINNQGTNCDVCMSDETCKPYEKEISRHKQWP